MHVIDFVKSIIAEYFWTLFAEYLATVFYILYIIYCTKIVFKVEYL
jgi:hypothetical protein